MRDRTVLIVGAGGLGGASAVAPRRPGRQGRRGRRRRGQPRRARPAARSMAATWRSRRRRDATAEACRARRRGGGAGGWARPSLPARGRAATTAAPCSISATSDWQSILTLNLSTAWWLGQEVGRRWCAAGYGRMVFVSSVSGLLAHAAPRAVRRDQGRHQPDDAGHGPRVGAARRHGQRGRHPATSRPTSPGTTWTATAIREDLSPWSRPGGSAAPRRSPTP